MTNNDPEKEKLKRETAHWQTERRDEMATQGLKFLLLLNGGGAVALLAFLQAIWDKPAALGLVPWVVIGLIPLLVGAALSGIVHFVRYHTTLAYQFQKPGSGRGNRMSRLHERLTYAAFVMFLLGAGIVVCGALLNPPRAQPDVAKAKEEVSVQPSSGAAVPVEKDAAVAPATAPPEAQAVSPAANAPEITPVPAEQKQ